MGTLSLSGVKNVKNMKNVYKASRVVFFNPQRMLSIHKVTANLTLYTEKPRQIVQDSKSLRLQQMSNERKLVLMFSWFQANSKHLEKFCSLYTDVFGFDVLLTHINLRQLLLPVSGAQLVAADILKFVESNEYYEQISLHGFSVGGFMFGECLVQLNANTPKYATVAGRIKAQVWDSLTGRNELAIANGKIFFPKSPAMQEGVKTLFGIYNSLFYDVATKHYIRAEDHFHFNAIKVPALMFFSKSDIIGTELKSQNIAKDFEAQRIVVTRKCFENSPHVGHYHCHRDEYLDCLTKHLTSSNLLSKDF